MTQFCFNLLNGFTGQSLYDNWCLSLWNVTWTFLPILVYAVLDRDVSPESVLANPLLYPRQNQFFNQQVQDQGRCGAQGRRR